MTICLNKAIIIYCISSIIICQLRCRNLWFCFDTCMAFKSINTTIRNWWFRRIRCSWSTFYSCRCSTYTNLFTTINNIIKMDKIFSSLVLLSIPASISLVFPVYIRVNWRIDKTSSQSLKYRYKGEILPISFFIVF